MRGVCTTVVAPFCTPSKSKFDSCSMGGCGGQGCHNDSDRLRGPKPEKHATHPRRLYNCQNPPPINSPHFPSLTPAPTQVRVSESGALRVGFRGPAIGEQTSLSGRGSERGRGGAKPFANLFRDRRRGHRWTVGLEAQAP